MGWRKGKRELGSLGPEGRLGGLRRRLGEPRPFKRRALKGLPLMPAASDSGRKSVAVAKANVARWKAQAHQAYWRSQVR